MNGEERVQEMNGVDEDALWRMVDVSFDELDALPFGAIVVNAAGDVIAYNQYESRLARQEREAVVGKNFFRDVAPCTGVQAFEGRLRDFVRSKNRVSERFNYFFPFAHGPVEVTIMFLKLRGKDQLLIAVERSVTAGGALGTPSDSSGLP